MADYINNSLARGTAILECISNSPTPLILARISEQTGLDRSTTYRLLSVLQQLGYVIKHPRARTYTIGYKIYQMGQTTRLYAAFVADAQPFLRQLAYDLSKTLLLGALSGTHVAWLDKVEPPGQPKVNTLMGMHSQAHATALGKVLLSYRPAAEVRNLYLNDPIYRNKDQSPMPVGDLISELGAIRQQGYAINRSDLVPTHMAIAVATPSSLDYPKTGVSLFVSALNLTDRKIAWLVSRLQNTVREIFRYRTREGG